MGVLEASLQGGAFLIALHWWYRAQQWLSPQLYLTGRQTERRNLMKEPPSPMGSSSSEADSSAPRRYVRYAILTPLCKNMVNPMPLILTQ